MMNYGGKWMKKLKRICVICLKYFNELITALTMYKPFNAVSAFFEQVKPPHIF